MNFYTFLKEAAVKINEKLEELFVHYRTRSEEISHLLVPLGEEFIKASEGGKRLRGALTVLGYELTGTPKNPDILKIAAAFEIFQTAILAHDDIIDLSPLRRGRPTIYKALGEDHYGISQTICLGDIGFFLALRLVAESNFPDEYKNRALQSFSTTMLDTALGEMLDVEIPHLKTEKKEEDALTIFRLKTARYTIVGPMQLGAILGGADQALLDNIENFGDNLGIAFQIQDDILGVFGDEKTVGKSVTSDIEEGKNTLLITYAQDNATKKQKEILDKYYGIGKIGGKEHKLIKEVFTQTGTLEYSQKRAQDYVKKAKKVIPALTKDKNYQNLCSEMADFLVNRER